MVGFSGHSIKSAQVILVALFLVLLPPFHNGPALAASLQQVLPRSMETVLEQTVALESASRSSAPQGNIPTALPSQAYARWATIGLLLQLTAVFIVSIFFAFTLLAWRFRRYRGLGVMKCAHSWYFLVFAGMFWSGVFLLYTLSKNFYPTVRDIPAVLLFGGGGPLVAAIAVAGVRRLTGKSAVKTLEPNPDPQRVIEYNLVLVALNFFYRPISERLNSRLQLKLSIVRDAVDWAIIQSRGSVLLDNQVSNGVLLRERADKVKREIKKLSQVKSPDGQEDATDKYHALSLLIEVSSFKELESSLQIKQPTIPRKISDINHSYAEKLKDCGIRSLEDFANVSDLAELSTRSGVPVEWLAEWQPLVKRGVTRLLSKVSDMSPPYAEMLADCGIRSLKEFAKVKDLGQLSTRSGVPLAWLQQWQPFVKQGLTRLLNKQRLIAAGAVVVAVFVFLGVASFQQINRVKILIDRGNSDYLDGEYDDAIRAYKEAVTLRPNNALGHYDLANALNRKGQYKDSISEYQKALALKEGPDVHNGLGVALYQSGQHEAAIAEYQKAIALAPARSEAHYNLGVAYYQLGRYKEASDKYREAISRKPNDPYAHYGLGVVLDDLEKYDEGCTEFGLAIARFREVVSSAANDAEAHFGLGNALYHTARFDEAVTEYRVALKLGLDYPELHHNLAAALDQGNYLDEAVEEYRKAVALKPADSAWQQDLDTALGEKRNYDVALAAARKVLALKPDDAGAHYDLAQGLLLGNRYVEAATEYEMVVKLKPKFAAGLNGLGYTLALQGQFDQAVPYLENALNILPNDPAALDSLGFALAGRGQYQTAISKYEEALKRVPNIPLVHLHLAAVLEKAGDKTAPDEFKAACRLQALGMKEVKRNPTPH